MLLCSRLWVLRVNKVLEEKAIELEMQEPEALEPFL